VRGPQPQAWVVPWDRAGLPGPLRQPDPAGPQTDEGDTDLSDLVVAVRAAASGLRVPAQPSPWLPALPEAVTLDDLDRLDRRDPVDPLDEGAGSGRPADRAGMPRPAPVGWGLEDRPADQAQVAATFGLGRDSHLYVVGAPRSGRSTALRTLVAALARAVLPTDLHVYGIDCGSGALLALEALPHTGAVAVRTAPDRVDRLLRRLTEEVARRQEVLAAGGFADLAEQRARAAADARLPYVVLALDRWEGFMSSLGELDAGRLTEAVMLLLREGASVGLHVLVSGDRSLLSGRMGTLVDRRLVLRLADRTDYGLAGISVREVPESMPDGRGLWADGAGETQVALLPGDPSGQGQSEAVAALARALDAGGAVPDPAHPAPALHRPFRLEVLPATVHAAAVWPTLDRVAGAVPGGGRWTPVGLGGDGLDLLGLDLSAAPVAMVVGPPRSGRTSVLRFAAAAAVRRGARVLALCPRGGDLATAVAAASGTVVSGTEGPPETLAEALRALPAGSLIAVDDAELLREGALVPVLVAVVRQAREKGWAVLVAGETSQLASGLSGWVADARRNRQGLLLSPQTVLDGEAVGTRLTRSMLAPKVHPGRGLLVAPGSEPVTVQVPLV
jgi:S-DNA-T family DNA segregation ATPase FtsK/SpoIIIE